MMKRQTLLLIAIFVAVLTITAAPRTKAQMKEAAAKAINGERLKKRMAAKDASEMKTLKEDEGYEIIGMERGNFAVIAKDDVAPAVLGVSMKRFNAENTNFGWWLKAVNEVVKEAAAKGIPLTATVPDATKYPTQVGPLMTTEWDQLEPYNNLLPLSNGGDRVYTGCVATAMAQVLNYFQVPEHGVGQRTIYYPQGVTSGTPITATFSDDYYDWDNMLDNYYYGGYNATQALAVATLMRDCGVAADMGYGGYQENGSGAYSQDAAEGLRTYFGLADATCYERDSYDEETWMDMVYKAISEDGPIYYGGASWSSGGHAFVLHGYNAQGQVYVNWGWSGDNDGYYDISLLNPSYYQFDMQQDMITGVRGEPKDLTSEEVELTEPGTLRSKIGDNMIGTVGALKIKGSINSTDLRQIRRLAGIDEYGENTKGYLYELDITEARIVSGGNAYLIDGSKQLTTADDELPQQAFYGCKGLKTVKLPAGLKKWGDGAIALCVSLNTLEVGTPAANADFIIEDDIVWNTAKTEIVEVLPTRSGELNIPRGTTALHDYAVAGCGKITKVVIPSSVELIGSEGFRSAIAVTEIRIMAKEPIALNGANVFDGIGSTCKLYVPSGTKGKYAQKAQWNVFYNEDPAKNRIIEYGSSVKVRNMIRKYGEENPEFIYTIQGDPIEGEPVLSCEATPESPAGRYPITVSAGTITDENVGLIDGYLVVQKRDDVAVTATVNDATREEGEADPEFTLSYSEGLLFDATEPVWINAPRLVTTATADSPAGEYPITVEIDDAVAESYQLSVFTFVPGKLTVTPSTKPEPDGIRSVENSEVRMDNYDYYNLAGQRVTNPGKGIYIVNGKKYIVK